MSKRQNNQQPQTVFIPDQELRLSISNIAQIMQKINETVQKSQHIFRNGPIAMDELTSQKKDSDNIEVDDTKLIQMLKNKVKQMKIPLHQLHKKDKLSTVMQQSQSQSGRTVYQIKTPRDQSIQHSQKIFNQQTIFQLYSFIRDNAEEDQQLSQDEKNSHTHCNHTADHQESQKIPKKIMGIRKSSYPNKQRELNLQNITNKINIENRQREKKARNSKSRSNFLKDKSLTSAKYTKIIQNISHVKKSVPDLQNDHQKLSRSLGKKGLEIYSQKSLKSQNYSKIQSNSMNTTQNNIKNAMATELASSDRKQQKINTNLSIKKRIITPFMMAKKSCQLDKIQKNNNQGKIKTSLSRANIRDFYVSKRIHR